jgi:nitrogen fixation-related uncharacterized protein
VLALLTLIAIAWLRIPLALVLLGLGIPAFLWTYRTLSKKDSLERGAV